MRLIRSYLFICSFVIVLFSGFDVLADEQNDADSSRVLAVVPVKNGNVDRQVYRQFDRLIPELKKISKSGILKLECSYSGKPKQKRDVERAYLLASMIEKYFREHHKLDLDIWISVDIAPEEKKSVPVLTLAVFTGDYYRFDTALLVDPLKKTVSN